MRLDVHVIWLLAGATAGFLGGLILKKGGYGPVADLLLGLAGSLIGISIFEALENQPEAQRVTAGFVAFIGAASMIVGQRWWYPHA